jgi:FkbM family methyltransferase
MLTHNITKKTALELRNLIKEIIKGTPLEGVAKSVYNSLSSHRQQNRWLLDGKKDDVLANKILRRVLDKDSNCIDIGCNTGDFLIPILKLAPKGYHFAFEPIPRLAHRLRKRFPNIDIKEIALSDCEGETIFWYVVNAPALSSLQKQSWNIHIPNAITEALKVKTKKLDDIVNTQVKINFIKIDVEGTELQVFNGAKQTLKTHRPYILFEHGKTDGGEKHDHRIYDLLVKDCGLEIFQLQDWLDELPALNRDKFMESSAFNFLAVPQNNPQY